MTVRELRDKLDKLMEEDKDYGDAPVYYDDLELNLEPISAEEVNVVKAIRQPLFRHESRKVGDVFCCLNVNRYDCDEFEYTAGRAMVMPPKFINGDIEKVNEAMRYIARKIAEEVFKFYFVDEMSKALDGIQYTEEVKHILEIYREKFEEKVEDVFYLEWFDDLASVFMPWDVTKILKMAKETTLSLHISLTGNKEDTISF